MTLVIYDLENIKKASGAKDDEKRNNFKFDFVKLKNKIEKEFPDNVFSHCVFMSVKNKSEEKFANILRLNGYYVSAKRARHKNSYYNGMRYSFYDNDMDAYITSFSERFAKNYENVIIVSGDGDLSDVASHIRDMGKFVFIIGWEDNMSSKLKKHSYLFLDEWKNEIEKTN